MAGNGSSDGGDHDDKTGVEEEDLTPVIVSIGDYRNREMLAIFGNYLLESKEHTLRLETLYADLRQLPYLAHHVWAVKVLDLFEKHQEAMAENLEDLRAYVKKGA
jgi:class 3 adenylate cyclase